MCSVSLEHGLPDATRPRCGRARTSRHPSAGGFTLLEVLVALTIIAVALAAALRSAGALTEGSRDIEHRIYAQLVAQNELAEIRLSNSLPGDADSRYDCFEAGVSFQCHRRVEATPNTVLHWVSIEVSDAQTPEHALASLAMLVRTATP